MEKYTISAIDNWIEASVIASSEPYDTSSPNYYILVDYQDLITDSEIHRYTRTVAMVNDESRIEDASLYITELQSSNHQIVFHSIDLIREGESINVLDEENISVHQREKSLENHITDQAYSVSISIDDLRVGDIIDYQATTIIHADEHPLKGKYYYSLFWLTWNCPVYRQQIRIINHSKKPFDVQQCVIKNGLRHQFVDSISENETFKKTYNNIKPVSFENVIPNWMWPDFLLVVTQSSWQELSTYLFNYYKSRDVFENSIGLNELRLTNSNDDLESKVINIVRFVQNNIRYKGENHGVFTHTPKSPNRVLKNRYGDCKDKANLLVSLLESIGVKANLTLVNTDYGIKINQLSPSLYHFNHMIVRVEVDQNEFYFDPTIKKQAGDLYNSVTLNYGYGLVLSHSGHSLKKLPHDMSQNAFWQRHIFDFSKIISHENILTIRRVFYSKRANNMRYYLHSKEQELLANEYLQYAKDESNLELELNKPISIVNDDSRLNELETEEIYTIKNLTDDDDNKILSLPTNIYYEFLTTTNESQPLRIDLDGKITHEVEIAYRDIAPKSAEKKSITNDWFSYHDSISTKGNILSFSASAMPHKGHVESKDLKAYLKDVEQVRLRSSNSFPYKSGNFSTMNKMACGMFFCAFVVATLLVTLIRYNA